MSMTQKQAREYVANDSGNWELVETTEAPHTVGHVRLYILKYKNIMFARLDVLTINLVWVRKYNKAPNTDKWWTALYYKIEADEERHLVYPVRSTEMAREIWERSKADERHG